MPDGLDAITMLLERGADVNSDLLAQSSKIVSCYGPEVPTLKRFGK